MRISPSCLRQVIVLLAAAIGSISVTSSKGGEEGVEYGRIGSSITLMCSNDNNSSVAEWRFNGTPYIPWGFYTKLGHLELTSLHTSAMGNYSCYNQFGELLSSVLLKVGYPQGFVCLLRASDYENFYCYWKSSVETMLPTRYIASYRSRNHISGICVQEPVRPSMCSVRKSEFWSSYQMNITEENPLGSSFRLLEVTMQSIVKPDPPEKLLVEPIPFAPRRLQVSWVYPSTWPPEPHFQLKFRVQYRPAQFSSWSVVETVNLSDVITDAFAGMEHIVQVSAKDFLDAGNWSDWSEEVRAVPWTSTTTKASEDTTTTETVVPEPVADPSDPVEKVAMLISLGIFAFVVLTLFLAVGVLVWVRVGRKTKDGTIKPDFLSAIHMKALPKAQIL
ncbi:LOW QUALITY PROTEIN: interleukin-11 receptor subunit alpha [Bombina bombina]|uniref:LOW QUALITY PROTEIN: interleukin-11 receptor subunit alpha n=1 Tax=Bombina bombina TaxID=8345 RepID=UPI00235A5A79|nr:LOW QUALITY PROTEIN: interleukin-11 receptor subunit alpha [Bombina bombina]